MPSTSADTIEPDESTTDVVGARAGAQVVDVIVTFLLVIGFAVAVAALVQPTSGDAVEAFVALGLLLSPLYGGLLEAYWNGQTVGKRLLNIKVVDWQGREPGFGKALGRNIPAIVLFSWLTTAVALLAIATSDRNQRLFDQLAGTYVVDASPGATGRPTERRRVTTSNSPRSPPRR